MVQPGTYRWIRNVVLVWMTAVVLAGFLFKRAGALAEHVGEGTEVAFRDTDGRNPQADAPGSGSAICRRKRASSPA